jgi:hypothetical protein
MDAFYSDVMLDYLNAQEGLYGRHRGLEELLQARLFHFVLWRSFKRDVAKQSGCMQ